jgi:hypothetical protein
MLFLTYEDSHGSFIFKIFGELGSFGQEPFFNLKKHFLSQYLQVCDFNWV